MFECNEIDMHHRDELLHDLGRVWLNIEMRFETWTFDLYCHYSNDCAI